ICRSVPQIPARKTRMSRSLMPTVGSGTSSSHRPGLASFLTSAFIDVSPLIAIRQSPARRESLAAPGRAYDHMSIRDAALHALHSAIAVQRRQLDAGANATVLVR